MQLTFFEHFKVVTRKLKEHSSSFGKLKTTGSTPVAGNKARASSSRAVKSEPVELRVIWNRLMQDYFSEVHHLSEYSIKWSSRKQKRTLATCNISKKVVTVARELQPQAYQCWLEPLIYHEMCHAVLDRQVPVRHGKRMWHGREFRSLERRHPQVMALNNWIRTGGFGSAVRGDRTRRRWERVKSGVSRSVRGK